MGGELAARMGDEIGGHSGGLGWIGMAIGGLIGAVIGYIVLAAAIAAIAAATVLTGGLVLGLVIAAFFAVGTTAGLMAVGAKIGKRHSNKHLGGGKCGKITSGAARTFIENERAARASVDKTDHGDNKIAQGSKTVYVEGKPLSREGDKIKCGGKVIHGCNYTKVGGEPTEAEEIEDESQPSEHVINVLEKISAVGLYGAAALELGGAIVGAYVGAAAEGAVGSILASALLPTLHAIISKL